MSTPRLVACCPLLFLLSVPAHAELYHIAINDAVKLGVSGDFLGWEDGIVYPSNFGNDGFIDLQFEVDWEANTLTWGNFQLTRPNRLIFGGSKVYTVGPGQTETVNFLVKVDPFASESFTSTLSSITPTTGGAYNIAGPSHPIGAPLTLTGTWTATGPTETVEGPFNLTLSNTPSVSYGRVLTADYPHILRLQGEASATWSGGGTFIDTQVDGYPIIASLNSISYSMRYPGALRVPEPASRVLACLAALSLCLFHSIVVLRRLNR